MTERPQRQLSAILAADVAGYSRLMGLDEEGTLARLKELRRAIVDSKISEHRGRIVKSMGDGLLVQFSSAVDAVRCAVDVQHQIAEHSNGTDARRKLEFRIGINVGNVVVEGEDIYGDGVNIAARLESIAEPGTIVVSGTVHDHVETKLNVSFEDLGAQTLKNITRPVRAYRVTGSSTVSIASPQPLVDKPSIAVLPFTNMSGDPTQQYFSDGVTEDIVTELSRFRAMSVVARNTSFRFRGGNVDVSRVGRELGVQYVLEGSVRKMSNKIRITAQLIDAGTGNHLWAERFDRAEDEIFAVQDKVVTTIVGTLARRVQAAGVEKALRKPPQSLAAYDCVLRADALPVGDPLAQAEARHWAEKAVELDPTYGRAHAQLAISYIWEWLSDYDGAGSGLEKAYVLAKKAVALDENDSHALAVLGWVHLHRRSFDLAELCYRKSIALNANTPYLMTDLGILYGYLGRPKEGIEYYNQAKLIDPYFEPTWYWRMLGVINFIAGHYEEAIVDFGRSPTMPDWVFGYLAASYALSGQMDEATQQAAEALRRNPSFSSAKFLTKEPFRGASDQNRLLDGLRKAGLPE